VDGTAYGGRGLQPQMDTDRQEETEQMKRQKARYRKCGSQKDGVRKMGAVTKFLIWDS